MDMYRNDFQQYHSGDIVYVLYRNPHAQDVAGVQEAAVVADPDHPGQLALFMYDTYYPLNDELAVYPSEAEAELAYSETYGPPMEWGDLR